MADHRRILVPTEDDNTSEDVSIGNNNNNNNATDVSMIVVESVANVEATPGHRDRNNQGNNNENSTSTGDGHRRSGRGADGEDAAPVGLGALGPVVVSMGGFDSPPEGRSAPDSPTNAGETPQGAPLDMPPTILGGPKKNAVPHSEMKNNTIPRRRSKDLRGGEGADARDEDISEEADDQENDEFGSEDEEDDSADDMATTRSSRSSMSEDALARYLQRRQDRRDGRLRRMTRCRWLQRTIADCVCSFNDPDQEREFLAFICSVNKWPLILVSAVGCVTWTIQVLLFHASIMELVLGGAAVLYAALWVLLFVNQRYYVAQQKVFQQQRQIALDAMAVGPGEARETSDTVEASKFDDGGGDNPDERQQKSFAQSGSIRSSFALHPQLSHAFPSSQRVSAPTTVRATNPLSSNADGDMSASPQDEQPLTDDVPEEIPEAAPPCWIFSEPYHTERFWVIINAIWTVTINLSGAISLTIWCDENYHFSHLSSTYYSAITWDLCGHLILDAFRFCALAPFFLGVARTRWMIALLMPLDLISSFASRWIMSSAVFFIRSDYLLLFSYPMYLSIAMLREWSWRQSYRKKNVLKKKLEKSRRAREAVERVLGSILPASVLLRLIQRSSEVSGGGGDVAAASTATAPFLREDTSTSMGLQQNSSGGAQISKSSFQPEASGKDDPTDGAGTLTKVLSGGQFRPGQPASIPLGPTGNIFTMATIADTKEDVAILFSDIAGFTSWSSTRSPLDIVQMLNHMYRRFDTDLDRFGVEKITTVGDAYWAACGLPTPQTETSLRMCAFGLEMQRNVQRMRSSGKALFSAVHIRIGVATGTATGGIVGQRQLAYQVFGKVNDVAEHLEQHAPVDGVMICPETAAALRRIQQEEMDEGTGDVFDAIEEIDGTTTMKPTDRHSKAPSTSTRKLPPLTLEAQEPSLALPEVYVVRSVPFLPLSLQAANGGGPSTTTSVLPSAAPSMGGGPSPSVESKRQESVHGKMPSWVMQSPSSDDVRPLPSDSRSGGKTVGSDAAEDPTDQAHKIQDRRMFLLNQLRPVAGSFHRSTSNGVYNNDSGGSASNPATAATSPMQSPRKPGRMPSLPTMQRGESSRVFSGVAPSSPWSMMQLPPTTTTSSKRTPRFSISSPRVASPNDEAQDSQVDLSTYRSLFERKRHAWCLLRFDDDAMEAAWERWRNHLLGSFGSLGVACTFYAALAFTILMIFVSDRHTNTMTYFQNFSGVAPMASVIAAAKLTTTATTASISNGGGNSNVSVNGTKVLPHGPWSDTDTAQEYSMWVFIINGALFFVCAIMAFTSRWLHPLLIKSILLTFSFTHIFTTFFFITVPGNRLLYGPTDGNVSSSAGHPKAHRGGLLDAEPTVIALLTQMLLFHVGTVGRLSWFTTFLTSIALVMAPLWTYWAVVDSFSINSAMNSLVTAVAQAIAGYRLEQELRGRFLDEYVAELADTYWQREKQDLESIFSRTIPSFVMQEVLEWLGKGRPQVVAHQIDWASIMFLRVPEIAALMAGTTTTKAPLPVGLLQASLGAGSMSGSETARMLPGSLRAAKGTIPMSNSVVVSFSEAGFTNTTNNTSSSMSNSHQVHSQPSVGTFAATTSSSGGGIADASLNGAMTTTSAPGKLHTSLNASTSTSAQRPRALSIMQRRMDRFQDQSGEGEQRVLTSVEVLQRGEALAQLYDTVLEQVLLQTAECEKMKFTGGSAHHHHHHGPGGGGGGGAGVSGGSQGGSAVMRASGVMNRCVKVKTIGDIVLFAAGLQRGKRIVTSESSSHALNHAGSSGGSSSRKNSIRRHAAPDYVRSDLELLSVLGVAISQAVTESFAYPVIAGIHVGPVVGGVLGQDRLVYDVFGDCVNTASRVMSTTKLKNDTSMVGDLSSSHHGVWVSAEAASILVGYTLPGPSSSSDVPPGQGGSHPARAGVYDVELHAGGMEARSMKGKGEMRCYPVRRAEVAVPQTSLPQQAGGHTKHSAPRYMNPSLLATLTNDFGNRGSPLHHAGSAAVVYVLAICCGADVESVGVSYGDVKIPPLIRIAGSGKADVVRALLRVGADPNGVDSDDFNGCMMALSHQDTEIMVAFLEAGTEVDSKCSGPRGYEGYTALMLAAELTDGSIGCEYIRMLLQWGADATVQGRNGKRAADLVHLVPSWRTGPRFSPAELQYLDEALRLPT